MIRRKSQTVNNTRLVSSEDSSVLVAAPLRSQTLGRDIAFPEPQRFQEARVSGGQH